MRIADERREPDEKRGRSCNKGDAIETRETAPSPAQSEWEPGARREQREALPFAAPLSPPQRYSPGAPGIDQSPCCMRDTALATSDQSRHQGGAQTDRVCGDQRVRGVTQPSNKCLEALAPQGGVRVTLVLTTMLLGTDAIPREAVGYARTKQRSARRSRHESVCTGDATELNTPPMAMMPSGAFCPGNSPLLKRTGEGATTLAAAERGRTDVDAHRVSRRVS